MVYETEKPGVRFLYMVVNISTVNKWVRIFMQKADISTNNHRLRCEVLSSRLKGVGDILNPWLSHASPLGCGQFKIGALLVYFARDSPGGTPAAPLSRPVLVRPAPAVMTRGVFVID
jgi:hypothetical protein